MTRSKNGSMTNHDFGSRPTMFKGSEGDSREQWNASHLGCATNKSWNQRGRHHRVVESPVRGVGSITPYTQYPLFLGYAVDPLLKKEVFTLKKQVFPKIPSKKRVFGVGGSYPTSLTSPDHKSSWMSQLFQGLICRKPPEQQAKKSRCSQCFEASWSLHVDSRFFFSLFPDHGFRGRCKWVVIILAE